MGSKRKIIVASIIAVFAILIAVTAITITLALTYQTIETAIVVEFTASEVDAEINANMYYQNDSTFSALYTQGGADTIVFKTGQGVPGETSLSPVENQIKLTNSKRFVIFEYVFKNTGDAAFVATIKYEDPDGDDNNINISYSKAENGVAVKDLTFKQTNNAVLVKGGVGTIVKYYVKMEVADLTRNASLTGNFSWDLDSDILIVNPGSVGQVLSQNINGRKVVFSAGEYVNDIGFFPTEETLDKVEIDTNGSSVVELEKTEATWRDTIGSLSQNQTAHYYRTISDVTLLAEEGAIFKCMIWMSSVFSNRSDLSVFDEYATQYDPIIEEGIGGSHNPSYVSHLTIDGLRICGFDFVSDKSNYAGKWGLAHVYAQNGSGNYSNISIENCSFEGNENVVSAYQEPACAAIYFYGNNVDGQANTKNFTFDNIVINNYYQGISLWGVEGDLNYINVKVQNTGHNAIAIQSLADNGDIPLGNTNVIIKGCEFENIGNRAIRFNLCETLNLDVLDCSFKNIPVDDNGIELLKIGATGNGSILKFSNNYYGRKKLQDVQTSGQKTDFLFIAS